MPFVGSSSGKNHRGAKSAAEKREGMSWRIEVAKLAKPEWWHGNVVHFRPLDVHQNGLCKKSHTSCSLLLWPFTSRSIRKTYCHPHLLIDPFISIYIIYHFTKIYRRLYEKYRRKKHVIQRLPMDYHRLEKGGDFWPDVSTFRWSISMFFHGLCKWAGFPRTA